MLVTRWTLTRKLQLPGICVCTLSAPIPLLNHAKALTVTLLSNVQLNKKKINGISIKLDTFRATSPFFFIFLFNYFLNYGPRKTKEGYRFRSNQEK